MPKILFINGYTFYFWSNEKGEPVHIHISKKRPAWNSTKFWISKNGEAILAHNGLHCSDTVLNKLKSIVSSQSKFICQSWKQYFGEISFYC